MASFVDRPYQFKEFVQTTPVESMVKVGMQKQQQFDENVQKIQAAKDDLAGLPVMREVDKQYLQGMLSNLDTELTKVGAADFSKQQLVNSVAGAVSFISRDSNVMAAVQSTENHRNQQVRMEEARQKGVLTPANEYNYQKQLANYLSSDKVGEVFSASYKDYFDVFKHAKETFDTVKPDGYTLDQVYVTDSSGRPIIDKKSGKPVYSPTMTRLEKEGIFPEKVKQTLDSVFSDPRVSQQLALDGEYAYRNFSPDIIIAGLDKQKVASEAALNEKLAELNLKKKSGEDVQIGIDNLNTQIKESSVKYNQLKELAYQNPDAVKAMLYTDEVRNDYTSMFGYIKTKEQILDNPGWKANFDMMKEANDVRMKQADLSLKREEFAWRQKKDLMDVDIELKKVDKMGQRGAKVNADGSVTLPPTASVQAFQPSNLDLIQLFEQDYEKAGINYSTTTDALIFNTALDNPKNRATIKQFKDQGKTEAEAMQSMINSAAKANGESPDQYRARWRQKAMVSLNNMSAAKRAQNPILNDIVQSAEISGAMWGDMVAKKGELDRLEKVRTGHAPIDFKSITKDIKPINAIVGTGGAQTTMHLTAEDLYDLALYNTSREGFTFMKSPLIQEEGKKAYQRLLAKGKGDIPSYIGQVSPEYKKIYDRINKDENFVKNLQVRADILQQNYTINPNLRTSILTGNTEDDRSQLQKIASTVSAYKSNKKNLSSDFDAAKIQEIISAKDTEGPKAIELSTRKDNITGEITPVITFSQDGEVKTTMTITPQEALQLGINVVDLYKSDNVRAAENRMGFFNNNTTSMSGEVNDITTYQSGDAFLSKARGSFPKLANTPYTVSGNISRSDRMTSTGQRVPVYYGHVYVNDGERSYLRTTPEKSSIDQILQAMEGLTPQAVQALISEEKTKK